MFTVFAILASVVGAFLMSVKNREVKDFTWINKTGGYILVCAWALWMVVFISLIFYVMRWLWWNAP